MSIKIFLVVCFLVVVCWGDEAPFYGNPPPATYKEEFPDSPPNYKYQYGVSSGYSGANFGHAESRDGYKTEGSYTVDLPDGRKQTVTYVDNGDGVVAEVRYEGEAQYPDTNSADSYGPPPAKYA